MSYIDELNGKKTDKIKFNEIIIKNAKEKFLLEFKDAIMRCTTENNNTHSISGYYVYDGKYKFTKKKETHLWRKRNKNYSGIFIIDHIIFSQSYSSVLYLSEPSNKYFCDKYNQQYIVLSNEMLEIFCDEIRKVLRDLGFVNFTVRTEKIILYKTDRYLSKGFFGLNKKYKYRNCKGRILFINLYW